MVDGCKHSRSAASFTVNSFSIRTILQFPLLQKSRPTWSIDAMTSIMIMLHHYCFVTARYRYIREQLRGFIEEEGQTTYEAK